MTKKPHIVPVSLLNQGQPTLKPDEKARFACKLKLADKELTIYQGIDKYILHTVLKELRHL